VHYVSTKPVFDFFYPRIELIMNLIAELFGFVNYYNATGRFYCRSEISNEVNFVDSRLQICVVDIIAVIGRER